jgi:formate/nitrite transporter FocA (FNT family)
MRRAEHPNPVARAVLGLWFGAIVAGIFIGAVPALWALVLAGVATVLAGSALVAGIRHYRNRKDG